MDQKPTSEQQELFQLLVTNTPGASPDARLPAKVAPIPANPGTASRKPYTSNAARRKSSPKKTVAQKMAGRANARSEPGQPDRVELLLTYQEGQIVRKFAFEEGICVRRLGPVFLAGIAAITAARGRKEQK
jgi:hypothetical protein